MRRIFIITGFCFILTNTLAQSLVDSLTVWAYDLDIYSKKENGKPIGQITFWRTRPIDDGISKKIYGAFWTPNISYEIFDSSDSLYCQEQSHRTKVFSSCVGPDVGGDIFIIGHFIFLNRNVCLSCEKYKTGVDFCRPQVSRIIAAVGQKNIDTVQKIVQQFPIRQKKWNVRNR